MQSHRLETVLQLYASIDCDRLLDVGCGDGEFASKIGAACGTRDVYGVDIAEDCIRAAAENGVTAVLADVDATGLPFRSDSFDSIHAGECVDYFDDPEAFFHETRRCLTDDGVLVLSTPNLASLHNRLALLAGRSPFPMRASTDTLVTSAEDRLFSKRRSVFTRRSLEASLRKHGFEIVGVAGTHSDMADHSRVVSVIETVLESVPSLSYRMIVVCRPAA